MRRYALTDAEFGALGAGRPHAGTLVRLREAERGRRLLLAYATGSEVELFGAGARSLAAEHHGLSIRVRLEDTDPRRELLGLRPSPPQSGIEHAHWQVCFADAWQLLVTRHRLEAEIVAGVLECLVPVEPDPAAGGISATSAEAYGVVALSRPAGGEDLAVALVHELRHSLLNATLHLFDLVSGPAEPGYSPWRDDPRPPLGVLHGAYAYLAVTRFRRAGPGRIAAFEFARWRTAVADVADRLLAGGTLTVAGRRFTSALRAEVDPWLAEPVDPEIVRLAAAANRDHYLRWRLRNMAVDPADTAAIAAAWDRDEPAPAARIRSRLVPAPRRALENSPRLDLIHETLRSGVVKDEGGGDAAYLRGAADAAREAYREDLSWTGLALVSDLPERLEVLAAAHLELRAKPDPLAFARWITG